MDRMALAVAPHGGSRRNVFYRTSFLSHPPPCACRARRSCAGRVRSISIYWASTNPSRFFLEHLPCSPGASFARIGRGGVSLCRSVGGARRCQRRRGQPGATWRVGQGTAWPVRLVAFNPPSFSRAAASSTHSPLARSTGTMLSALRSRRWATARAISNPLSPARSRGFRVDSELSLENLPRLGNFGSPAGWV